MNVKQKILKIFSDSSGRPKITPRHESAIQVMLEENFTLTQVKTGLQKLEEEEILNSKRIQINGVGNAKFFFLKELEKFGKSKIDKKIVHSAYWIKRYSDAKVLKMIGEHLQDLVKAELRAQSFEIKGENVREFEGVKWPKKDTLDLIAKHKQKELVIGVEVKNTLYPMPKKEVSTKIKMCEYFGITPVFAARRMENHRNRITYSGGFLWQFKKQLYPRGQEKFVSIIQKRFKLPVTVSPTLPYLAIKDFEEWTTQYG